MKGLEFELQVISHLKTSGHEVLFHRFRSIYAEIDIVSIAPDGYIWLIEAKSSPLEHLISHRQRLRQERLQEALLGDGLGVDLYVCIPNRGKFEFVRIES